MRDDEVDRTEDGGSADEGGPARAGSTLHAGLAMAIALVATGVSFALVWLVTSEESHTRQLFFERSWIQYVTVYCFWLTLVLLGRRWLSHRSENVAVDAVVQVLDRDEFANALTADSADLVLGAFADSDFERFQSTRSFHRMRHGLRRLRNTHSTRELDAYFQARGELDHAELETRYATLRYLVWLIPTLGFIGTVLGIGGGISGFAVALEGAADFQAVRAELPLVTGQLGTAFDTTLLALLLSVVVGLVMAQVRRVEEGVLDRLDGVCVDRVCGLFQESSPETERLVVTIDDVPNKVITQLNARTGMAMTDLKDKLPALIARQLDLPKGGVGAVVDQMTGSLDNLANILEQRLPDPTTSHIPSREERLLRKILEALEDRERSSGSRGGGDGRPND